MNQQPHDRCSDNSENHDFSDNLKQNRVEELLTQGMATIQDKLMALMVTLCNNLNTCLAGLVKEQVLPALAAVNSKLSGAQVVHSHTLDPTAAQDSQAAKDMNFSPKLTMGGPMNAGKEASTGNICTNLVRNAALIPVANIFKRILSAIPTETNTVHQAPSAAALSVDAVDQALLQFGLIEDSAIVYQGPLPASPTINASAADFHQLFEGLAPDFAEQTYNNLANSRHQDTAAVHDNSTYSLFSNSPQLVCPAPAPQLGNIGCSNATTAQGKNLSSSTIRLNQYSRPLLRVRFQHLRHPHDAEIVAYLICPQFGVVHAYPAKDR